MPLDVEKYLQPISDESPCGEDVSYDPEFMELERAAQGTEESQFAEAEEPDWRAVRKGAEALMERSRHLQVSVLFGLGALKQGGLPDLADALEILLGLIDRHWDTVHPQLDPDDDNDPTERVNIISSISPRDGSFDDSLGFPGHVLDATIVTAPQVGDISTRQILLAQGELAAPEGATDLPSTQLINAAFQDASPDDLLAMQATALRCRTLVESIDETLSAKVGAAHAVNFDTLAGTFNTCHQKLTEFMVALGIGEPAEDEGGDDGGGSESGGAGKSRPSGDIQSNADVVSHIDRIIKYYQVNEPASPVPLVLKRARKLVGLDFLDLLKDLAPDAIRDVRAVSGKDDDDGDDD